MTSKQISLTRDLSLKKHLDFRIDSIFKIRKQNGFGPCLEFPDTGEHSAILQIFVPQLNGLVWKISPINLVALHGNKTFYHVNAVTTI